MSTIDLSVRARGQSVVGTRSEARVDYVDALRVLLILLVVAHHSVEAYVASHAPEIVFADAPIPRVWAFLAVNASFFMGLFFFLAGYYTPQAYDRRGAGRFLRDRLIRIGIPLLLGVVLIVPLAAWIRMAFYPGVSHLGGWEFVTRDFLGIGNKPDWWPKEERWPQFSFGWLWFIEHLLIYAMLYTAWRLITPPRPADAPPPAAPAGWMIFAYAIGLAAASYVVRIWYPQDRWIAFLGFIQMEPAHWPQYASLFVIGVIAGRGHWIETMPRGRGLAWLAVGGGLALLLYVLVGTGLVGGGAPAVPASGATASSPLPDWRPVVYDAFMCTGLCVGLPVAFRELALGTGSLWRMLGRNVLAIYVFHFPFVELVQVGLMQTDLAKWIRLLLTWPIAVVLTVLFTNYVVLRLPGLRRVF